MKIFIDETGDPHPSASSTCFGVGALFIDDDELVQQTFDNLARTLGEPSLEFHATTDSETSRQMFLDSLNQSELRFDFKFVAYDVPRVPSGYERTAAQLHRRALSLNLSLLPFCQSGTEVIISERAQSFQSSSVSALSEEVDRLYWQSLLTIPELRRADPNEIAFQVVQGTPSRGLQLCDHLLWRCQRSLRNQSEAVDFPNGSIMVRPQIDDMRHFQCQEIIRGSGVLNEHLAAHSRARPQIDPDYNDPFKNTYGCLAMESSADLSSMENELIRLLCHADIHELMSEASVSHICYLILHGRTRWRHWFPLSHQQFGLLAALSERHLGISQLDRETLQSSTDAARFALGAFRREYDSIVARQSALDTELSD